MKWIKNAADVIAQTVYEEENTMNKDIASKIAATLLDCDGIETLIPASEDYTGGKDVPCFVFCLESIKEHGIYFNGQFVDESKDSKHYI